MILLGSRFAFGLRGFVLDGNERRLVRLGVKEFDQKEFVAICDFSGEVGRMLELLL